MINRDIYLKDPSSRKLVNEGVATVNDDLTSHGLAVLRYELETFVCDGQYRRGLSDILSTYLANINQAQQPAVWVSGFFGSGKSHLVKMLRALWSDTTFDDGATARGIANLPQEIQDQLRELSVLSKRHGGVHAASGTLGSGARDSVRLALLGIIFKSVGLPDHYPKARFVMWLQDENILDEVRSKVEAAGHDWDEELDNLYVAEGLHSALARVKPMLFSSTTASADAIRNMFPYVSDVTSDDMIKAIERALSKDGKLPLTLVVLDEVQQYIGEDSRRSIEVQEAVEAICKKIGGKILFIGTGQTAVTGTSNLKKLEGRFTVRVELSDTDVEAVIRQVILAKKPESKAPIESLMQTNLGEISRHLSGTTIGHRSSDIPLFPQDYPILPVRSRFWESMLRVLDQTGTDSQLRNQLSLIHKVIQTNLESPLGTLVPADYLYFDSADKLLQTRILPRKVHEKTMSWYAGNDDERLIARACGLVFLINKLGSINQEVGIKANVDTLADLLVSDIQSGSSSLRSRLPGLLGSCELLIRVGDEFRIQTEESAAWNDDFLSQRAALSNEAFRIDAERDDRIKRMFSTLVKNQTLTQGTSKVPRTLRTYFDSQLPGEAQKSLSIWVRDGWSIDEASVRADARQAGNQSPVIYVFIPKRSADDLRYQLIEFKAALATLEKRGVPNTPEGTEARAAMETTKQNAEARIKELLTESFSGARVFQGGGNEVVGSDLQHMILEAGLAALQRLYPSFDIADNPSWGKVYERAQKGQPDALSFVGYAGDIANNPVCKSVLKYIGAGKSGSDIRTYFENPEFGWSVDAIDGAIQVLLVAGHIRMEVPRGQSSNPLELERRSIGKTTFKVEVTTITTPERIQIRKLMQKLDMQVKQNEESASAETFYINLLELAQSAGGDAPSPERPSTMFLESIASTSGNEQLMTIYNLREDILTHIDSWKSLASRIHHAMPGWILLQKLMSYASGHPDASAIQAQMDAIVSQRQLLVDPNPVAPLLATATQLLRDELNDLKQEWTRLCDSGESRLLADENWNKLDPEVRHSLLQKHQLLEEAAPKIQLDSTEAILNSLIQNRLDAIRDRIAALNSRYDQALLSAAQAMEPELQEVGLPKRTLRTPQDVDAWIEETRRLLHDTIKKGPVLT
jgi:hypothetical protein